MYKYKTNLQKAFQETLTKGFMKVIKNYEINLHDMIFKALLLKKED